jgi:uncharacterized protein YaiI (UPF0178 family)
MTTNDKTTISPLQIWVDADACPVAIRNIIFRTAKRLKITTTFVANQTLKVPPVDYIRAITVPYGADIADHEIVANVSEVDLVITNDIPLASRVVAKGATAIGMRGQLYDDATVHGRLASRNLMEQLRSAGMDTRGPKPLGPKDIQTFANRLDKMLTKLLRKNVK